MSDIISRQFVVQRGEREIVYPFTTLSSVFRAGKHDGTPAERLMAYLAATITMGVPELPNANSISQMPELIVNTTHQRDCDLVRLATAANYRGRRFGQHEAVQTHFLHHDPATIAYEVPVHDNAHTMSGHIDLVRILAPDRLQVIDFKPEAAKERKASSQIFRYRICLAERLGIALKAIEAAYFDDHNAYFLTTPSHD